MPLPTVLLTDTVRSTHVGQSHGGAYLVDLERGTWRKVIDWTAPEINWDGRGNDRGLRGTVIHGDDIYIASSNELMVFDRDFTLKRRFSNSYLGQCHELFLDGGTIYLASTKFDSVLAFDTASGEFTKAWMYRHFFTKDPKTTPDPGPPVARAMVYDPRRDKGPKAADSVHLNQVWVEEGKIYFSGVRIRALFYIDPAGGVRRHANLPDWTHNARPFRGGVLANSTGQDAIVHFDQMATPIKQFPTVRYNPSDLQNVPTTQDVARQAFARGLVTTPEGLIIGGSSPSTVTVYDYDSGKLVKSINITMDVRCAPHGMTIWPF